MRSFLTELISVVVSVTLIACGGVGGGGDYGVPSVNGTWNGTWYSGSQQGGFVMEINQNEYLLAGAITFVDSDFISGGVAVTGQVDSDGDFYLSNPGILYVRGKADNQEATGTFTGLLTNGTWDAKQ